MSYTMKRMALFLERLNHSDQPPEAHSPLVASFVAALFSFALIFGMDSRFIGALPQWWAELLVYAVIPILLAFILLYRSSWHHEMRRATRALVLTVTSCTLFGAAVIVAALALLVISCTLASCLDRFSAFHY
jgi:hypothetical protein